MYYIISTGLLISLVFLMIYQIVSYSVHKHIDDYINEEVIEHLEEIKIDQNNAYLIQVDQWRETKNNEVNVNAVFVQFFDVNNQLIDKSPNLKNLSLQLYNYKFDNQYVDTYLNGKPIRQIQVPILDNKKIVGRIFIAISLDEAILILTNLKNIFYVSFPVILILLFFIARFIAGRSIKPVIMITETSSRITKDNLKERMILPQYKDELFALSKTINDLLDSIENAVAREKQFTSAASHELRTPLAVLKGTLEVLTRKPRTQSEYEEKINYCITEVDRLNHLVDELLLLTRFEDQKQNIKYENVYLNALVLDVLTMYSAIINNKNITVETNFYDDFYIDSDTYLISIIISNIVSNAVKYSNNEGTINIELLSKNDTFVLTISDNGIGIVEEDFGKIFDPFYRSKATHHPEIKGTGLGLSIVKRLCDLLNIQFKIAPNLDKGITFTLFINK